MDLNSNTDPEMAGEEDELEQSMKQASQQLDLMDWKVDRLEKELAVPGEMQCIAHLMESVQEVKQDYEHLKQELLEVQALQRELSGRLRTQLKLVHSKFARLREKLGQNPH